MILAPDLIAATVATAASGIAGVNLLAHYDYADVEKNCDCPVCQIWRERQTIYFIAATRVQDAGHPQSCRCDLCRDAMKKRGTYIAAQNKRTTLCETSYHAAREKTKAVGITFMSWLWQHMTENIEYPDRWWETTGSEKATLAWFREFSAHQRATLCSGLGVGQIAGR